MPKRLAPGSPIAWEREIAPGEVETCTGVIWSDGPVASSYWVIPDDAPAHPVAVKLPGKRMQEPWQLAEYTAGWARDAVRRADNVLARGIYAVIDRVDETWQWKRHVWHTDPQCPDADGKERDSNPYPAYDVWSVVDILIGRHQPASPPPFCGRCIYLTEPGVTGPGSAVA